MHIDHSTLELRYIYCYLKILSHSSTSSKTRLRSYHMSTHPRLLSKGTYSPILGQDSCSP